MDLQPKQTDFPVQTQTTGGLRGPVAYTTYEQSWGAGLMVVDCVGRFIGSWRFIQGSNHNHENGGKTNCITKIKISPEAAHKPPRHSRSPHQCFHVLPYASTPPWSIAKCSQTLQWHSAVLLKPHPVMGVHSKWNESWRLGESNIGAVETSMPVWGRLQEQLCRRLDAVFSTQ